MFKLSGNSIPLYTTPPAGIALYEDLEHLLITRDTLLNSIESSTMNQSDIKLGSLKNTLMKYENTIGWTTAMENDKVSHFILSLAFCKTDQERIWLANLESKLFMARIYTHDLDQEEVLKLLNIPLERQENLSENILEKIKFREYRVPPSRDQINQHNSLIYRIPFEYALNHIPTMHYFLHKGFIYITKSEISQLIETAFKENMIRKLVQINRHYDRIMSDSRIYHLIRNFKSKREVETLSKSFNNVKTENISYKDIDAHAEKSFPLCMLLSHRHLTANSHLTHNGRLQYGMFLKGMGLSLEESMNFWKMKFSKKYPEDKFEKEYAYNIRHNYGKEGRRNDYVPWSCYKIQNLPAPSVNESHGCPFKYYSEEKLRSLLVNDMRLKELDVLKILDKKRNNEFSVIIFN
jgi:DNA primase large subunit